MKKIIFDTIMLIFIITGDGKMIPPNESINSVIEELKRQNSRLAIINQIAQSINVEMSYEEIIEQVATPLRSVLPYDLLSFCLLENDQLIIKSGVPKEQKKLGVGWKLSRQNSAPWKAIKDKSCFLRQDIWNDSHRYMEDGTLRSLGIKSAIMAPLLVKNEVIGTLNFGSKLAFAYSENDFVFVEQMADQLAVCINNSRLFSEVLSIKSEWEQTFQAVPDRLFLINPSYVVLRHNRSKEITNEKTNQVCYKMFSCCGGQKKYCPSVTAFKTGRPAVQEVMGRDNKTIFNISAYPVSNEKGRPDYMVIYVQDITARRNMESQLFQSAKFAAIGEMAAGVAHELNSPLTAIIGNTELLARKKMSCETTEKLLQDIKSCSQRCNRIIQNLLTFSRQDSYAFEPILIHEVIKASLSLVSYQIKKSNINIIERFNSAIPPIMGNKQQLEQVIINLLLNARDALEGISNSVIEISTEMKCDHWSQEPVIMVNVSDNGCGIPDNIKNNIFNLFFTTKEKMRGTGLGLSVSLGIAQTHGGRIEVSSTLEKGSVFTLVLPLVNHSVVSSD
ncbi:sensor histidine kinase [Desulfosporosinus orientis]|nr:sensor histidine kinase [Desulfosporosinus orientis]